MQHHSNTLFQSLTCCPEATLYRDRTESSHCGAGVGLLWPSSGGSVHELKVKCKWRTLVFSWGNFCQYLSTKSALLLTIKCVSDSHISSVPPLCTQFVFQFVFWTLHLLPSRTFGSRTPANEKDAYLEWCFIIAPASYTTMSLANQNWYGMACPIVKHLTHATLRT